MSKQGSLASRAGPGSGKRFCGWNPRAPMSARASTRVRIQPASTVPPEIIRPPSTRTGAVPSDDGIVRLRHEIAEPVAQGDRGGAPARTGCSGRRAA